MMEFDEWCEATDEVVNGHDLKVLSGSADHLVDAHDKVAAIIPAHYASEEHVAHVLERLGKAAAAEFVRQKLPESKAIRSGDLGEILATEYISENTPYEVPIKRLRWNDHRNMAMRGDDVIGVLPIPLLSQAGQNTVRHVTRFPYSSHRRLQYHARGRL